MRDVRHGGRPGFLFVVALCLGAWPARAQGPLAGNVSVSFDHFPRLPAPSLSRSAATELRLRTFAEWTHRQGRLSLHASGYLEALALRRRAGTNHADWVVQPQELHAEVRLGRFDLRAGFGRLVWGRLDELQPGDLINPLDLATFFFDGRSEARLPVALVRARWHFGERASLEGVGVPRFRAGRFDLLDEETSPFRLETPVLRLDPPVAQGVSPATTGIRIVRLEPAPTWRNVQGGARLNDTTGRLDWAVSVFRGFEQFPIYRLVTDGIGAAGSPFSVPGSGASLDGFRVRRLAGNLEPRSWNLDRARGTSNAEPTAPRGSDGSAGVGVVLVGTHPRTTAVAADFETAKGAWGVRGEIAAFLEDSEQTADFSRIEARRSFQAGVGLDREAGAYRFSGAVVVGNGDSFGLRAVSTTIVGALERSFARESRRLRGLGLVNAADGTAFLRIIGGWSLRDAVWLEGSGGVFVGRGTDVIGLLGDRDFLYARLRWYF